MEIINKIVIAGEIKLTKFKYIIPDNNVQNAEEYSKMALRQSTPVKKAAEKEIRPQKMIELGKDKDKVTAKTVYST